MRELQDHPLADFFPLFGEDELKKLSEDIAENGVRQPVVLFEGKILDGRNRYRAARMAGMPFPTVEYKGDNPAKEVFSLNIVRRHLTPTQCATIGTEILAYYEEEAKKRESLSNASKVNLPDSEKGQARDKAAAATGASPSNIQKGKKLKAKAPDLYAQCQSGEITINKAMGILKERQAEAATDSPEPFEEPPSNTPPAEEKRQRGTVEDWKKFREIGEDIEKAVSQLSRLKVDSDHRAKARDLASRLAKQLTNVSNQQ